MRQGRLASVADIPIWFGSGLGLRRESDSLLHRPYVPRSREMLDFTEAEFMLLRVDGLRKKSGSRGMTGPTGLRSLDALASWKLYTPELDLSTVTEYLVPRLPLPCPSRYDGAGKGAFVCADARSCRPIRIWASR
jgi:hypothetical protein